MQNRTPTFLAPPLTARAVGAAGEFLAAAPVGEVNPLHQICLIAAQNLIIASQELAVNSDGPALAPWAGTFAGDAFPTALDGEPLYDSVEFAGEAALYRHLNADPDLEILLTGALVWQLRGIDAIVRRKSDGYYLLCEAKGSSRPLAAPLAYLPETKKRGRQLSWRWCWNAILDMADHPATAAAFLMLLQPILEGRVERLLTITHATHQEGGWYCAETHLYPEHRLHDYPPLARAYPLTTQRAMFEAMIATPQGAAIIEAAAGVFTQEEMQ
jgi:hypothetical protein